MLLNNLQLIQKRRNLKNDCPEALSIKRKGAKRKEENCKERECARANEGDKEKEEGAQGESASWLPTISSGYVSR